MSDRIARAAFVASLAGLSFVYGLAVMKWELPPYRVIHRIEAGIEAMQKMEDQRFPMGALSDAEGVDGPDPVVVADSGGRDDLVLVTGGFFHRMDLCPTWGCMAYVTNRAGQVVHTWEADPTTIFTPETFTEFSGKPKPENVYVNGIALGPDGSLAVTFQGRNVFPYHVGIARFGWDGTLEWVKTNHAHHWPSVGPDGRIYTPVAKIEEGEGYISKTGQKIECEFGAVYQEGVAILSPAGEALRTFWMEDIVAESDQQGLAYSVRDDCDPYHINHVGLLGEAVSELIAGTSPDDLIVSVRSSSSVVIMDADDGRIRRVLWGPMVAQHSPVAMPNGSIALFDNMGGKDTPGRTRILSLNPAPPKTWRTLFPRSATGPGSDLHMPEQGGVRISKDGRHGLIADTEAGRIIEFDVATGEVTWMQKLVSDMAPFLRWKGEEPEGPVWKLMHAKGADYVDPADFARWNAGAP